MMTPHAATIHRQPEVTIARWRIEALRRAWDWSRTRGLPFSPYIAIKAL